MDLAHGSPELLRLMDDLLAFNLRWIDAWTQLEYDGLHFADDWGGQTGLIIHPRQWRQLFKPRYAEMFYRVHQANMDVWFHSDGKINEILPDLVEIGANVINCQARLVGYDWIERNLRGVVAFRTDIDRQQVLPFGSPTEVQEEVHRTFEACGSPNGGIIACGEIGPDVPLDNIRAMYTGFPRIWCIRSNFIASIPSFARPDRAQNCDAILLPRVQSHYFHKFFWLPPEHRLSTGPISDNLHAAQSGYTL